MVVVGADHDDLVLERGVAAFDQREDIAKLAKRLIEALLGGRPLQTELLEPLGDVDAGGPAAATARLAPFEGVVGQGVDEVLDLVGGDRGHRSRFRLGLSGQGVVGRAEPGDCHEQEQV